MYMPQLSESPVVAARERSVTVTEPSEGPVRWGLRLQNHREHTKGQREGQSQTLMASEKAPTDGHCSGVLKESKALCSKSISLAGRQMR